MSESTGDTGEQSVQQTDPAKPSSPIMSDEGVVWVRFAPSQVVRTIVIALLTAAVVLGALYLLWQIRTFIGWCVLAVLLAVVLNPAVDWLQRRRVPRTLGIVLTYLGVVVALILIAGIFVPLLINEIGNLISFIVSVVQDPRGVTEYLRNTLEQFGLGFLFDTLSARLAEVPSQLGEWARSLLLSAGGLAVSAAGFVTALVTILTVTFFLLLNPQRFVNVGLRLFAEPQRPRVRRLLAQSSGAVFGYITGNLVISLIAGVTTFIVLVVLGMPYPAALALLVAILDLIPLVGATLGATIIIVVALFVAWWKALILLVFFLIYQQFEGSVLQPLVYSRAVHLDGLTIFSAVLVGGLLLGIPGALLAIPVAEIIRIVVTDLLAYRRVGRGEEEDEELAVSSSSLQPPT
jgi:predicted PurR-regulated permease PerM